MKERSVTSARCVHIGSSIFTVHEKARSAKDIKPDYFGTLSAKDGNLNGDFAMGMKDIKLIHSCTPSANDVKLETSLGDVG